MKKKWYFNGFSAVLFCMLLTACPQECDDYEVDYMVENQSKDTVLIINGLISTSVWYLSKSTLEEHGKYLGRGEQYVFQMDHHYLAEYGMTFCVVRKSVLDQYSDQDLFNDSIDVYDLILHLSYKELQERHFKVVITDNDLKERSDNPDEDSGGSPSVSDDTATVTTDSLLTS